MKKNNGLIIALIIFIILTVAASGYIVYDKFLAEEEKVVEEVEKKDVEEKEETSKEEMYDVQIKTSEGLVYLDDSKLYKKEKEDVKEIADNVIDLYKKNDKIYAILENQNDIKDDLIKFLHQESLEYSTGTKRSVECSKILNPEGFAGSSSHKIILIGDELYYSNTNEAIYNLKLIATGVSDISQKGEYVVASKTDAFQKYDDLTYIDYQ